MVEFKKYKLTDLFDLRRGKTMSKEYIKDNKGDYPVYSSQTKDNGILGYINDYMFDLDAITWTTDGIHAGHTFVRSGKFSLTNVCGLMLPKDGLIEKGLSLTYIHSLIDFKLLAKSHGNKKVMTNQIENANIEIEIPVKPDGSFNVEVQEEIANRYKQVETIKHQIEEKLAELSKVKVSVDIEDLKESVEFKSFNLEDLAYIKKGNSKYTKKYCNDNNGVYEVFAGNTQGLFGNLNSYDFDLPLLTYSTDGGHAGTIKVLEGKYNIGGHRAYLDFRRADINFEFIKYILGLVMKDYVKKGNIPSISINSVNKIEIQIPVNTDGSFNTEVQEAIASRYKQVEDIQIELVSKLKELKKLKITI